MIIARNVKTGSAVNIEADQYRQIIALSQGGTLQTAAVAGRVFSVSNQAKVATTVGLTTTWTGLGLVNPSGSKVNVIIHKFGWAAQLSPDTAGVVGLMTSTDSGTTAEGLIVQNCLDGSSLPTKIYATDGANTGTLVLRRVYGDYGIEDTATSLSTVGPHIVNFKGNLMLPPGRAVYTYTTLATATRYVFHFVWEEVVEYS